jgi:hypothetical protein
MSDTSQMTEADWLDELKLKDEFAARQGEIITNLLNAINHACDIIENADHRLLAQDGPAGGQAPPMSLDEWRRMYVSLDKARKPDAKGPRP